jgi:4-hydroxybenzoate polyprenyltransferase
MVPAKVSSDIGTQKISPLRYWVFSMRLRRLEYRVAELPIFLIPVLLTVVDGSDFLSAPFWEGLFIFLLLFAFGDLLNCLADRDLDAVYKPYLSEAVDGIGPRGVMVQAGLSALAALVLAAHLAWLLNRWALPVAVLAGIGMAYAYSVEPLRLKRRGWCQLAFYWIGLFTAPMIFATLLFTAIPAWGVCAVAVAYGMLQTGVILVNTAEDYPEDRKMGVNTVVVALGLRRGIAFASVLTALGSVALLAAFATEYASRRLPSLTWAALLPLVFACLAVGIGVLRLHSKVARHSEIDAMVAVRRSALWVPVWLTSTAITSLLAAAVAFFWS